MIFVLKIFLLNDCSVVVFEDVLLFLVKYLLFSVLHTNGILISTLKDEEMSICVNRSLFKT